MNNSITLKDWKIVVVAFFLLFVYIYNLVPSNSDDTTKEENKINSEKAKAYYIQQVKSGNLKIERKKEDDVVLNSPWDGGVWQVENYLESTLRDPDSYQSIKWERVIKNEDGTFSVGHTYRAKNGFGGMNVQRTVFLLDNRGNVIGLK